MQPFNHSKAFTLGVELETQVINNDTKNLVGLSEAIFEKFNNKPFANQLKPEVTTGMLEINSSIHDSVETLSIELNEIKNQLVQQTQGLNVFLSGGGTHPFQLWNEQELSATEHYKAIEKNYGYLAKMNTVFGMHIHIGCASANNALYLTHALQQYVPHFIALSAASPYCQGIDTQFCSSRSNVANLFPVSGMPPFILEWSAFCNYVEKMSQFHLMTKVDNFYWDIRPRAEFGTIEIRVFDMPLSIEKAVQITAFVQALACYLLEEKSQNLAHDHYDLHRYNRFQASKLGFNAAIINTQNLQTYSLVEDILNLAKLIAPYSKAFGSEQCLSALMADVVARKNDATSLRAVFSDSVDLKAMVAFAGKMFAGTLSHVND